MGILANHFKRTGIFTEAFDKHCPEGKKFSKKEILNYLTICSNLLFTEAKRKYPLHGVHFINPVFVQGKVIYRAANLKGDFNIVKLVNAAFHLVKTEKILPVTMPIIKRQLQGICLFFGGNDDVFEYTAFKTFNLDKIEVAIPLIAGEIHEEFLMDEIDEITINLNALPPIFNQFADDLCLNDHEKALFKKTLILYKNAAEVIDKRIVFAFVNKFNKHTPFNCLLTVISEQPFEEDLLFDFAQVIELICAPIANRLGPVPSISLN